jgi:thiol-disulfide isomerase/thioredoxin
MALWNRRSFVAAGAAGFAGLFGGADASITLHDERKQLFQTGPLAHNMVARQFEAVPKGLVIPRTTLLSASGEHTFAELRGKARIVSLWAEWCIACLVEMPDLLKLQQRFGGAHFEVLAILTASLKKLDLAGAKAKLESVKAGAMPLWIEPDGGMTLFKTLASTSPKRGSLPCTLLVDPHGHVRGRAFGMPMASTVLNVKLTDADYHDGHLTKAGQIKLARAQAAAGIKTGVLTEADKANTLKNAHSLWSTPDGAAFAKALADGALG